MTEQKWSDNDLRRENIGWTFPSGNGGELEGFNDPKRDSFKLGLESLTREVIQNSLDAVNDTSKPVHVEFSLSQYKTDEIFPFKEEFEKRLDACRKSPSNKTLRILETATAMLHRISFPILKISDYNTTGLTNPLGQDPLTSTFLSLLKGSGLSTKTDGTTGGSFGLGKTAPFTCSDLRTVFYYMRNLKGERAFQGKSILASHEWMVNSKKCKTRSVGYFGKCDDDLTPLAGRECELVPSYFRERNEPGTDVFVLGLAESESQYWNIKIRNSILLNFFVAIMTGRLTCTIHELNGTDTVITKATIAQLVDDIAERIASGDTSDGQITENTKDIVRFFKTYTSGRQFTIDSGRLEGSELYILPVSELASSLEPKGAHARCVRKLYIRRQGMKIDDKSSEHAVPAFVVFLALGKKLDAVLQKCEPAAHNKWEIPKLSDVTREERNEAKECLSEINSWIMSSMNSMISVDEEEFDAAGLGEYLPVKEEPTTGEKQLSLRDPSAKKPGRHSPLSGRGVPDEEGEETMEPAELRRKDTPAPELEVTSEVPGVSASPNPEGETGGTIPNPQNENDSDGGTPNMGDSKEPESEDSEGDGLLPQTKDRHGNSDRKTKSRRKVDFNNFRCAGTKDSGKYVVMFSPESDINDGKLRVTILGETGAYDTSVSSVSLLSGAGSAHISKKSAYVGIQNIPAGSKVKLLIGIPYNERVSMSISLEDEGDE